jgi:membrane protein DedA with SNARE-associated domain
VDLINALILQAVDSPWVLAVMFAAAVIDGFFPPVPSETVLVAAAAVAASTGAYPAVLLLTAVAAAGAWLGDNIAFAIGRGVGTARFRWMRRPRVAAGFTRAQRALEQRGTPLILGARYIPVGRVAVNMSAGAVGYPWRRFLSVSGIGAVSWAALSAGLGWVAGQWVKDQPVLGAAIGIGGALAIGLIVDRVAAARRARSGLVPHSAAVAGN